MFWMLLSMRVPPAEHHAEKNRKRFVDALAQLGSAGQVGRQAEENVHEGRAVGESDGRHHGRGRMVGPEELTPN